jgi:PhzF family phenazine biosynthesis protein
MATPRGFSQVDVFCVTAGLGNPLAVVMADADLDDARMQAMARWLNLAETTFLLPPTTPDADYRVRIFTGRQEIAFAGHPSIGSAHAALVEGFVGLPANGLLRQECKAGVLPIRIADQGGARLLSVRVPRSRRVRHAQGDDVLLWRSLAGRGLGDLAPALVEGGRRWWLAELADENEVRTMQPDAAAILALAEASGSLGLCVFARCHGQEHDLVVRAFPLGVGLQEDPASGAANAAIAAFLDEAGALGALGRSYRASQGREMGRDARLHLEIDDESQVWVGGQCHTVIRGAIDW